MSYDPVGLDDLVQRAWSLIAAAMSGSPRQFTDEWKDAAQRWEVDYCIGQGASGLRSRSSVGGGGVVSAVDADAPHQREPGEAPDTPGTCRAPHCWSEYGTPCANCPFARAAAAVHDAFAAGRAAATPDPPTSWECCGHTFTGTADFISGARSAHVCDIAPEDVPDAETAYAMGKAAATPPAEGSVSYRVRDRDSDYKAMCHEDRDHAELLLKAWLADGRDAVVERRHVFDGGWLPVGRPFFTGQQERMLDRCEAFDAANPDPETDT